MEHLISFDQFSLNESLKFLINITDDSGNIVTPKDFKQVQILTNRTTEELSDGQHQYMFIAANTLYKHIHPDNLEEYNSELPTLNLASVSICNKWINDGIINTSTLYNQNKYKEVSLDKLKFHKFLGNKPYLPKTVFTPDAARYLKYPIIAKPAEGHSGIGINKFNAYKDLVDSIKKGDKFDVYSEAIQIDKEYRLILIKDSIVAFMFRKPNDEKTKFFHGKNTDMEEQGTDSKLDFTYINMDPNEFYTHFSDQDQMQKILSDLKKEIKLEYITIDCAIDTNGKIYVIEINSTPGAPGIVLSETYRLIFEDFYKRTMDAESMKYFREVQMKALKLTMKNKKYEFSDKFIDKYIK